MGNRFAVAFIIAIIGLLGATGSIVGCVKQEPAMVAISIAVAVLNWVLTLLIFA